MASFRTSPEQDSPSTMTSEMFVRMTDKQTKPEGSPEAKGLQMKEAAWFFRGKVFCCEYLEFNPRDESLDEHTCKWTHLTAVFV